MNNNRLAVVSLIGRPNVGKSTLFNILTGKRRSITAPVSGVTRDPVEEAVSINGHDLLMVDTGGFQSGKQDYLAGLVSARTKEQIANSAVILLIVAVSDINADDESLFEFLRPVASKIILVVNKVDNQEKEADAWNLLSFGFRRLVPISAIHNSNIELLQQEISNFLAELGSGLAETMGPLEPEQQAIRLVLIGKPNSGKSTLANRFLGVERSIVSSVPGTTRDVLYRNFSFQNQVFRLADTAGIRRRAKVNENVEYYSVNRAIASVDDCDVAVLLIDINEGLSEQDKKITTQLVKRGVGIIFALNKADMRTDEEALVLVERLRFLFPALGYAPIVSLSAKSGTGSKNLLRTVIRLYKQLNKRVATSHINQALADWQLFQAIPELGHQRYKIRYITQVSSQPIEFIAFVNKLKGFPEAYRRYIVNQIRRDFGLSEVPINLILRERIDRHKQDSTEPS